MVLAQFKGSDLLDSLYSPPFRTLQIREAQRRVISADYVTAETGTGLVHTAPAHGAEDYARMKELGMLQVEQPFSPVDDQGRYTDELGSSFVQGRGHEIDAGPALVGQEVLTSGARAVIALLDSAGLLLSHAPQRHRYPCDWRSKQPVLVRATWQWFANLDEIQHAALDALKDVRFVPAASRIRLESFVKSRKEWCISRQRAWGLPIPVVYNDAAEGDAGASTTNSVPLLESDNVEHIAKVLREHGGMDYWWIGEPEEFVLPRYRDQFPDGKWRKGTDTIDVWFDSGSSWATIRDDLLQEGEGHKAADEHQPIADVYLEGSDQHRGWFQSSLLIKMATAGAAQSAPYKNLLTHGMVVDKDGKKMSKSLGNIVSPLDFIHGAPKRQIPAYGTDVLRLWVARSDYTKDAPIGNEIITKASNALRKLRNTARFMLANLRGQEIAALDSSPHLLLCERLVLHELHHLERECVDAYDRFDFATVSRRLNEFATTTLSTFYLDVTKDSLYSDAGTDQRRRAVLATLDQILRTFTTLMAPIAPHLAEEIHQYRLADAEAASADDAKVESVFRLGWQTVPDQFADPAISAQGRLLAELKDRILTLLETCRKEQLIASAVEAEVWLTASEDFDLNATLREHAADLNRYFTTSGVHLDPIPTDSALDWTKEDQHHGLRIIVGPARLQRCPRCWLYTKQAHETLCNRCDTVVNGSRAHGGS